MSARKQFQKIWDVGSILLYVLPAAYIFLSAAFFQFSILTDITKALQLQNFTRSISTPITHEISIVAPIDPDSVKTYPAIPSSKSLYFYFLTMASIILIAVVIRISFSRLSNLLKSFYRYYTPPLIFAYTPHLRAPPSL